MPKTSPVSKGGDTTFRTSPKWNITSQNDDNKSQVSGLENNYNL